MLLTVKHLPSTILSFSFSHRLLQTTSTFLLLPPIKMAPLALVLLLFSFTSSSSGSWCVCKDGSDTILQKTLDYACGAGADCNPIKQNGPCFQPNTVRGHCNYAVNSYFQKKGQTPMSCDFAGTATVTASDPSTGGCSYPASASTAGTSTTSGTTTPTMGTSTGSGTISGGVLGGIGNGMGPSGVGTYSNDSNGGHPLSVTSFFFPFYVSLFSAWVIMMML